MKRTALYIFLIMLTVVSAYGTPVKSIESPDGNIRLSFHLDEDGVPCYSVEYKQKPIILPSKLGLETTKSKEEYAAGFKIKDIQTSTVSQSWNPVWGENDTIHDEYNAMIVSMSNPRHKTYLDVEFRVYDDGIGFRYVFPKQKRKELVITDELSQFAMPEDMTAWWIPGDYDTQEYEYTKSRLSEIRGYSMNHHVGNVSQQIFSPTGVQTSLMLKTDDGVYINIHEAALIDYPAMHLNLDDNNFVFTSWLTPDRDGNKAMVKLPFSTPWRAIMISDKATDILVSNLILNLNEPCKLEDTSWINPVKYMGVWWEMITGKSAWSYCDAENFDLGSFDYATSEPHGRHGANDANVRRYIDFASENGFDQLLIEGWNVGWEDWFGKEKDYVFDFITPYPDFDIKSLNEYAHSKGIRLMMHHETSASIPNYERWIDQAFSLMNKYGYNAVKSGYVGKILPLGENHYNQKSVRHYLNCVKKAAEHKIMVNAHEAVRPTGLCRTYPNLIGNESAMGTEYQNMSPNHVTILPFTRLKGGPMDFTPGIFKMDFSTFVPANTEHKRATIANQLALYVTMYSPLQMAADLPEHYAEKMDAFQFIKDVPVDWSKSLYLDAEPGEYIIAARKDKHSNNWFVGGVTNVTPRNTEIKLDFLNPGEKYHATLYMDGVTAHYNDNPESYIITSFEVNSTSAIPIRMASGGGFAMAIKSVE